jgi:hypothetical protein
LQGQILLPHKHSQGGPGITVGDVDGDKLEDFIVGGSASNPAKIFLQHQGDCEKIADCSGRREFLVKSAFIAGGLVLTLSGAASVLKRAGCSSSRESNWSIS